MKKEVMQHGLKHRLVLGGIFVLLFLILCPFFANAQRGGRLSKMSKAATVKGSQRVGRGSVFADAQIMGRLSKMSKAATVKGSQCVGGGSVRRPGDFILDFSRLSIRTKHLNLEKYKINEKRELNTKQDIRIVLDGLSDIELNKIIDDSKRYNLPKECVDFLQDYQYERFRKQIEDFNEIIDLQQLWNDIERIKPNLNLDEIKDARIETIIGALFIYKYEEYGYRQVA